MGEARLPRAPLLWSALKSGRAQKGTFSPKGLSFVPRDELPNPALQIRPEPRLTLPRGPKSEDPPRSCPYLSTCWQRAACYPATPITSPPQTLHPQGAPPVSRHSSGEWPSLRGCWRRRVQSPPLHGAVGAQPLSVQGLLVCLFEMEGHRSQQRKCPLPGSYDCVLLCPLQTFLSLQVSSRPEAEVPQAGDR